jgi:uncharacterized membrane protein
MVVDGFFILQFVVPTIVLRGNIVKKTALFKELNYIGLGLVTCSTFVITVYEGLVLDRDYMLYSTAPVFLLSVILFLIFRKERIVPEKSCKNSPQYKFLLFSLGMVLFALYQTTNVALQIYRYPLAIVAFGLFGLLIYFLTQHFRNRLVPHIV